MPKKDPEQKISDAIFAALQQHGIDGDVANFLTSLNMRIRELEKLVRLRAPFEGGQHSHDCPGDDTCSCDGKEINETVQRICETFEKNEHK